jgi:DNA-binding NarL/FixJ family response regulator
MPTLTAITYPNATEPTVRTTRRDAHPPTARAPFSFVPDYVPCAPRITKLGPLTSQETEVLRLIATGVANKHIGQRLVITERTVKGHVQNIFGKLGVESRTQAALYAVRQGLV